MRLLLTGGGGFLGRHVQTALLAEDAGGSPSEVVPWRRDADGDLRRPGAIAPVLERVRPDVVLHLAWTDTGHPGYDTDPGNAAWAAATVDLARSCISRGVHVVGVGTNVERAIGPSGATPYARSKRQALTGLRELDAARGWTWLRPFWIYSAADRRPRLLSDALQAQERGEGFHPRTPELELDFIDVRDVAAAIALIVHRRPGGVHDIGTGRLRSVASLLMAHRLWEAPPAGSAGEGPGWGRPAAVGCIERWGWRARWTEELLTSAR